MKKENLNHGCSPVRKRGDRNVFCPHYGQCLDFVVEKGWEDWDCRKCIHYDNKLGRPEDQRYVNYSVSYYDILSE